MDISLRWKIAILIVLALALFVAGSSAFGPRPSYLSSDFSLSSFPLLVQLIIVIDSHVSVYVGRLCIFIAISLLAMSISLHKKMRIVSVALAFIIPAITIFSQYQLRYSVAMKGAFFLPDEAKYSWYSVLFVSVATSVIFYIAPASFVLLVIFFIARSRQNSAVR